MFLALVAGIVCLALLQEALLKIVHGIGKFLNGEHREDA